MLTERFDEALLLASRLHRNQYRKRGQIPYLSHLMRVAGLVMEYGGDESVAIAALLHDAVEDQGGLPTAQLIREKFGERVEKMVLACSDSVSASPESKRPWKERKLEYLNHLVHALPESRLICACDKLDNISSSIRSYPAVREAFFDCFNSGRQGFYWYYDEVVRILEEKQCPVAPELAERVRYFKTISHFEE